MALQPLFIRGWKQLSAYYRYISSSLGYALHRFCHARMCALLRPYFAF